MTKSPSVPPGSSKTSNMFASILDKPTPSSEQQTKESSAVNAFSAAAASIKEASTVSSSISSSTPATPSTGSSIETAARANGTDVSPIKPAESTSQGDVRGAIDTNSTVRLSPRKVAEHSCNFKKVIQVRCGQSSEVFTVHESLLLQHSGLFRNEIVDGPFSFGETDALTMQTFLHWLYFHKNSAEHLKPLTTSELLRVWVFADKSDVGLLKLDAMKQLRQRASLFYVPSLNDGVASMDIRAAFSFSDITYVFANTSTDANPRPLTDLRKLLVEWFVANCESMEQDLAKVTALELPPEFLYEVVRGMCKKCKTQSENKNTWVSNGERASAFHTIDKPAFGTPPVTRSSSQAGGSTSHAAPAAAPAGTNLFSPFRAGAPATPAVSKASAGQTSTTSIFGGFGRAAEPSASTTSTFGGFGKASEPITSMFPPTTGGSLFGKVSASQAPTPKTSMFSETSMKHGSETDDWQSLSALQEYRFLSTGMIRLREEFCGPTFAAYGELDAGSLNLYQSLSAMPQYRSLSHEELRMKARFTQLTRLTR